MSTVEIAIRTPALREAGALATLHAEAWRYAYRGLIEGVPLERMIARHGPRWWRWRLRRGRVLVLSFAGKLAGYADFGPCRSRVPGIAGEINMLYLSPEYHGAGLGRRLFRAAREALAADGRRGLVVWCVAANFQACAFYRAMGGKPEGRSLDRIAGAIVPVLGFVWR